MAGTSLAAHMRRFAVVVGIAALVVVVLAIRAWYSTGPVRAAGNSITSPDTVGNVGSYNSLALDSSGHPVISYYSYSTGDLKLIHCGDADCLSGNTITSPDTVGDVGQFSSLALDASGNPVVSYYDNSNQDLKVLRCGNANCTSGNTIASPDTAGDVGARTSLKLDASGNPVVSYADATTTHIKLLHCGNATCTAGNSIASPDAIVFGGADTSLALDAAGHFVISHDGLRVVHCGNANCTAGNVVATPGPSNGYSSLALDSSGNPVITAGGALPVLHCGDPNCTSGNTITTPDPGVSYASEPSLVLDASGNPVVSYAGGLAFGLRVLHCGNPSCISDNSIAAADSSFVEFTSLTLDPSGNPVVAYNDFPLGDLKVLHCGNPACKGPIVPTPTRTSTPTLTPTETPCPTNGCLTPTPTLTPPPTSTPCPPPVNDDFASAILIGGLPFTHSLLTTCATEEAGEPFDSCMSSGYYSVWYTFTPTSSQTLQADTIGSNYDTFLAVYTGSTLSTLNLVMCDDNSGPGSTSLAVFTATAGTIYHIQVAHRCCGDPGTAVFNLDACKPGCPTATPTATPTHTPTPAVGLDFSIGIDTIGDQSDECRTGPPGPVKCTANAGSALKLHVYLNHTPNVAMQYTGIDVLVDYSGVTQNGYPSMANWPDCAYPGALLTPGHVYWGCSAGYLTTSTYTGLVATNEFTCSSSGLVSLVHKPPGTDVTDSNGEFSERGSETLTINCLAAIATPTATPTRTPRPQPLGGVADYPNAGSGGGAPLWVGVLAGATGLLALGAATRSARRRRGRGLTKQAGGVD